MSNQGPHDRIDLNSLLPHAQITIRSEPEEDAVHRRRLEFDEARHRRTLFWAIFTVLLVAAGASFLVILLSDDNDTKQWARNIFSSIVGLLAGYAGGTVSRAAK